MRVFESIRRRPAAFASGATITAAAVAISTLAALYDGVATADLTLDDGGVWVTRTSDLLVGHVNYPSRQLDAALRTRAADFDILQQGNTVLVHDAATSALSPVDPATATILGDVALPAGADVALGGATVGVAADGGLYATGVTQLLSAVFGEDDVLAEVGAGAAVAVSHSGESLFAAAASTARLTTVSLSADAPDPEETDLSGLDSDADLEVSAVGERPVVFDRSSGTLFRSDGSAVRVPGGADGRLQQSSGEGDAAYVSTKTALVRVPLAGGEPEIVGSVDAGVPTAPVWIGGCAYAVWSASGAYVRDCAGDADDVQLTIDVSDTAELVLRANRRVVVVNDIRGGAVWVVTDKAEKVDNWDDVVPPADDDSAEEESEDDEPQYQLPERSEENSPPTAEDDEYGVRPGRSTILRVTENDTDPDGDLLSAALEGPAPTGYDFQSVLGGAALQVAVPANATGTVTFTYRVDDGRGGTDDATVTLRVHEPGENSPPVQKKVNTLQVELGASVTYSALDGWVDPDGDDFYLESATVEGDDALTFRSNGVIEYLAASGETGLKTVTLVVTDGTDSTTGELRVDVRPEGTLDPIANADRVTATAGIPVTISPLDNDVSVSGEKLRLSRHESVRGATVTPDYAAGTIEFVSDTPGTYYLQYQITEGPRAAVGIIRVDVVAAQADGLPPVAVRDLALLPSGRQVLVDVLANDTDPTGGILVVQSAQADAASSVSVEVLEHSVLRITDLTGLSSPVTVFYTVSNGAQSARGEVLVMPVQLPETLRPPVAVQDTAVVRAGDVVTLSVLDNDYHPDGDTISLLAELAETNLQGLGTMFVDGKTIRFQAGSEPGEVTATYNIEDSQYNRVGGFVRIQILPGDSETNSAPRAKAVTARVVAGNTTRIAIPLDGIDPDGDSVELLGVTSNPSKGRVTAGATWLVYEAYADASGVDTFTYAVRDHRGAQAESTVSVGVATPGFENQAPYAVKDVVSVRPGRKVAIAVTANDSDPDGDAIVIDPDALVSPTGITAKIVGGRVVVTAPQEEGEYTFTYRIADAYGATADGVLLVTVSKDAALATPIARDDRVSPLSIGSDLTATVAVLENDEDPDGTVEALKIEVFDPAATVRAGVVSIPVTATSQIVRYSITDEDGQIGQAFIFVPGQDGLFPTLADVAPLEVISGQTATLALADYVHVRSGRTPRIAVADSVRTGHSNGAPLLKDEHTLQYTSADGYFGRDSIGVLVTDGTGPDDPEGLTAYASIPVTVLPASNQPPTVRGATVKVAPGEDAVTVNLAKLTTDPDPDDTLSFQTVDGVPGGLKADISGSTLTIAADASVTPGEPLTITVEATDSSGLTGRGTITVLPVVSQRPMPVANDDVVAKAAQGSRVEVPVLANDFNPFAGEGELTIVSARLDSGRGEVSVSGGNVVVTPASDFVGTLLASYRVRDVTDSAEREAEARITVNVLGRPAAPGTPTVTAVRDQTVVLSWTPPTNNGAAITGYTVTSTNGYSSSCATTTCTLTGLTNDVEYTFRVVATNEIGDSDPSPPSAVARPDARPDTPTAPRLVFGDKSLVVSWAAPRSTGSPVLSYNLEISPAPATGSIQKTGVTGTSLTWEGLENGVAYQVRVQAVNRAPEPSEWSGYSASEVPAGVPDAPGQPVTSPATPVGSQAQIAVSWAPPASSNGDAVAGYTLSVKRGGAVVNTLPVTGTAQNVVVDASETDYTFSVTAHNKAGVSAPSAESAPRRGALAPGAPAAVVLTPTDRAVGVTITPGPLNGNRAGEVTYYYRVNQTGAQGTIGTSGGTIGGLNNGTQYSINVWAVSTVQGVAPGAETGSNAVVPFGKPIITLQSIERLDNAVRFRWNVNANGSALTSSSHGVDGSGNGSTEVGGLPAGGTGSVTVTYANAAGSSSATWSGQANDPPPPASWLTSPSGASVTLNFQNYAAGSYLVRCWASNSYAERNWNDSGYNYGGEVGTIAIPANGTVRINCPNPRNAIQSGRPLSVELVGKDWIGPITVP